MSIAIERVAGLSRADFAKRFLADRGRPVIVTDAIDAWPARSKWTLQHFKAAYGHDIVIAPTALGGEHAKIVKLADYLDHLGRSPHDVPGFWVNARDGRPLDTVPDRDVPPLYLLGWGAFGRHPELHDDIARAFYFVDDWMASFDPVINEIFEWASEREYWAIYIGPVDAVSKLHQDFWSTHTALAQIAGRKQLTLFAPDDAARATPYECVVAPGETLFIPAGWWHAVRSVDASITLSHSIVNHANGNEHLKRILRKAPGLAAALEDRPEWRARLGITETC